MTRGPAKTPTEMKVIAGTFRKHRDRETAPSPIFPAIERMPDAPKDLDAAGREMWRELGGMLAACGVLRVVDLYALQQLCYCWQRFRQRAEHGMPVKPSSVRALRGLFAEFGLSPAARRRVLAKVPGFATFERRPT